jgi:hypothetical protein
MLEIGEIDCNEAYIQMMTSFLEKSQILFRHVWIKFLKSNTICFWNSENHAGGSRFNIRLVKTYSEQNL